MKPKQTRNRLARLQAGQVKREHQQLIVVECRGLIRVHDNEEDAKDLIRAFVEKGEKPENWRM